MTKFSRNLIVDRVLAEIDAGDKQGYVTHIAVKQPYTHVTVNVDGFHGYGFSKVSGTDKFDAQFGIRISTKRAVRQAVDGMRAYLTGDRINKVNKQD